MKYTNLLIALYLFGIVDQVHGSHIQAEITGLNDTPESVDLPLWMFPCEISEGDMFYFTKKDGALELRCGAPPE